MRLNRIARVGIILGAGILFAGLAVGQTVEDERRALARAKAQASAADQRATRLARQADAAKSQADSFAARSAAVAARIQSAEADITAAEARIKLIETMRAEQRARLATKQEPAVRLVAALQMMSRRPPALALVQPGTTTDLVHVRALLASMMPAMRKRTEGLRAEIARGRKLREDADRALSILATGQQRLKTERGSLVQLAAQNRQRSQILSSSAMLEQDRAIALGEKARDIVDLIDQLGEASAVRDRLENLPGPVMRPTSPLADRAMPVDPGGSRRVFSTYRLPVTGTVLTGLGEVSSTGVRARGLTIRTRPQALAVAPTSGRIAFAGAYRGFGKIVIIDHGSGWTTLLTDLDRLDVRVGDRVVEGSPIGKTGTDEPKVTIELRKGATPIDITRVVG